MAAKLGIEANSVINKNIVEDVKTKANKDLRAAIQLLQFFMQGQIKEARSLVTTTSLGLGAKKVKLDNP